VRRSSAPRSSGSRFRSRAGSRSTSAAGGFTCALLDAGAARVYAVDAGHGQLIGSLALVKPQFELRLGAPPPGAEGLRRALRSAIDGTEAAGWSVCGSCVSPVRGAGGSVEFFVYAVSAGSSRRR
jgi:predicted rRNA methylase YqxC with S4 and FtsJ domains